MQTTAFSESLHIPVPLRPAGELYKPVALFVDDDPVLLEGLRISLRKEMFEVFTATSAEQGMEILLRNRVDVVVSDQCMPGTKGVEFLRMVKELSPQTVRILLTGQARTVDMARAVNEANVSQILMKPCDTVELVEAIDQSLFEEATRNAMEDEFRVFDRPWSAIEDLTLEYPKLTSFDGGSIERYAAETVELYPDIDGR